MTARIDRRLTMLSIAAALLCSPSDAQTSKSGESGPPAAVERAADQTAAVTIDGETLFRLAGVSAYPAEKRAALTSQAILDIAEDPSFTPGTLRVEQRAGYLAIMAGQRLIVSVSELDSALEQVSQPVLAEVLVKRINTAIQEYRAARRPEALLRDGIIASAIAIGFCLALLLFIRVWRFLERRAEQSYKSSLSKTPARALTAVDTDSLWNAIRSTLRLFRSAAVVVGALFAGNAILSMFPWTTGWAHRALELVLDPLGTMGMGVLRSIPDLVFLAVLVYITKLLLRLTQMLFTAVGQGSVTFPGFYPEWALPTYRLVRVLIVAFALVVGYPYLPGSSSDAFKGLSILFGLMFSIGSSGTIANVVAGYSLIYRRIFRSGDMVQIGDVVGHVDQMRLQVTYIRTLKNEEVSMPNSQILNSNVKNYTSMARQHRLILHTTVGIGYETPWRQVEAMLLMAASRSPYLLSDPSPFVLQKELGDFAVVYELNVYCDQPDRQPFLYTEMHRHILDVFNEYGVQIMTPAYESDPVDPKVVARDNWLASPAEMLDALSRPEARQTDAAGPTP